LMKLATPKTLPVIGQPERQPLGRRNEKERRAGAGEYVVVKVRVRHSERVRRVRTDPFVVGEPESWPMGR
jgi:hypothetical protein